MQRRFSRRTIGWLRRAGYSRWRRSSRANTRTNGGTDGRTSAWADAWAYRGATASGANAGGKS